MTMKDKLKASIYIYKSTESKILYQTIIVNLLVRYIINTR